MKVPKMLIDYTVRFGVPIGLAYYYWNPRSDEEIRQDLEKQIKPDPEMRRKRQAKFAELLLQGDGLSDESKKQLDQATSFTKTKKEYLADQKKK